MTTPSLFPCRFSVACKCLLIAAVVLPSIAVADTVKAWLLLSDNLRESIISTDPGERDTLQKGNWKLNGVAELQAEKAEGLSALHRMAKAGEDSTDRVLAADESKVAENVKAGYHDEGVVGFVSTTEKTGLVPAYHFTKGERHLWLFDAKDRSTIEGEGWKSAGVSFWVWPVASEPAEAKTDAKPAEEKTDDKPTEAK
jgi:hypothetical protein